MARQPRSRSVTRLLRAAPALPEPVLCEACGKHRYATRQAAEIVAGRASEKRRETRAYYVHGWWHLTSQEDERAATAAGREDGND
jgi:hypothetical protein